MEYTNSQIDKLISEHIHSDRDRRILRRRLIDGESEFLSAISGKDPEEMWLLMDELMETLAVINPRLYDGVMRKI